MAKTKLSVGLFVALLFVNILAVGLNVSTVSAQPVVDGVISPGEYAGAMPITLVGPYPPGAPYPPQTVDAYIEWDNQYLWVAVNEPVPPTGGSINWIEFCMDAGPWRPNLDAFVLFSNGVHQYVRCNKPSGSWGWAADPFPWSAATNTATEFQITYTDYGITFGDTIKMVVDRGKDDYLYMPFGDAVIWPSNPTFYPSVTTADLATWGDVTLNGPPPPPPPPTHVVDGVIGAGEYDGGMSVTLVGRTDPTWTVGALIDWDAEYLYVAVNEPVPATSGHNSWIEFAFDAGPSRLYLDAFVLFDDGFSTHVQCPKPPGGWGWVSYSFLAATASATEFRVKYTDFGISLGDTIKMSIDRNQGPSPPPPYGFAAFWPQNALVYQPFGIDPSTWGDVYLAPPPPPPSTVSLTVVSAYDWPSPSGTTSYTPGTSVTASVTSPVAGAPGYRYVCTGWTGTGDVPSSGTDTTVTFTINVDSTITWNWKTQTYLTVKTDPLGIATIPGEGWYDMYETVTLTAPPVPGYEFEYWDFNGVSQGMGVNPITVQVKCVATAHYTRCILYPLTVTASPAEAIGGTFKVTYTKGGTTYTDVLETTDWTESVDCGSTVTLSGPQDPINIVPGVRYRFDHYDPSASFIMTGPTTATLVYKRQFYLTVSTLPPDLVPQPTADPDPDPSSPSGWYDECSYVTLTASPLANSTYRSWKFRWWLIDSWAPRPMPVIGEDPPKPNPTTVHMDAPKYALAVYYPAVPDPIGDVNYDGVTDMLDLAMIARAYGAVKGEARYSWYCDVYEDGRIDIIDLAAAARHMKP